MPNTYTQLLIQYVFAVKNRNALIKEPIRPEIEKYIGGIIKNNNHVLLTQYCMPDHTHILIGLNPVQSISDLAKEIKSASSGWINDNKLTSYKFNWQEGFGAFSYSRSQLDNVAKYILNQKEHHRKVSFKEEYLDFLKKFEIPYNELYLFDWLD
jgi:REP element-mobilizing transposase RayT